MKKLGILFAICCLYACIATQGKRTETPKQN